MAQKILLIKRADGGVSYRWLRPGRKPEDALAQWSAAQPAERLPATFEVVDADHAEFPPDKTFRDAWEVAGGRVAVNMPKARPRSGPSAKPAWRPPTSRSPSSTAPRSRRRSKPTAGLCATSPRWSSPTSTPSPMPTPSRLISHHGRAERPHPRQSLRRGATANTDETIFNNITSGSDKGFSFLVDGAANKPRIYVNDGADV